MAAFQSLRFYLRKNRKILCIVVSLLVLARVMSSSQLLPSLSREERAIGKKPFDYLLTQQTTRTFSVSKNQFPAEDGKTDPKLKEETAIKPTMNSNKNPEKNGKKYVFYLCDSKVKCYGLGDRQRAIVGVYLLAETTNRTFGLIMTNPANFSDFYRPNLVNWEIPQSELEGKSTTEITDFGRINNFFRKINFNKAYPQDVVYIRTNVYLHNQLQRHPTYKYPKWANIASWKVLRTGWFRLMKPSEELRQVLNQELVRIVQKLEAEREVYDILINTKCCAGVNTTKLCLFCEDSCKNTTQGKNATCTDTISKVSPNTACIEKIRQRIDNTDKLSLMEPHAGQFCYSPTPSLKPRVSVQDIQKLQGYDTVELNLVCVHIRLGKSSDFPFEPSVRNTIGSVFGVWKFLKPFVEKGHHVYLATDSNEVREMARDIFGEKIHTSSEEIVHIGRVRKNQDRRQGFRLALMEQLLLITSCNVLVISYSGFSMKAASIREYIRPQWEKTTYVFDNGHVEPKIVQF